MKLKSAELLFTTECLRFVIRSLFWFLHF